VAGKYARHRHHALVAGAADDGGFDIRRYQQLAAGSIKPVDVFDGQHGASPDQAIGGRHLGSDFDRAERLGRIQRDFDGGEAGSRSARRRYQPFPPV
jgi:hypothetical protein